MLTCDEDIRENKERFVRWYRNITRSSNAGYVNHAIDILDCWLNEKIPNCGIGCLFRYDSLSEYDSKLHEILALPTFERVNLADSRGRPQAALNKFTQYLKAVENGSVEDIAENNILQNNVESRNIVNRRNSNQAGRVINCMEGLIDLLIGENACNITDENERFKILAQHMISKTYFFKPETVDERHRQLLANFQNNEKIPTRMSTMENVYLDESDNPMNFSRPFEANNISSNRDIFMNCCGKKIRVLIDRDGNAIVRKLIEEKTGARVSQGTLRSNIKSAIISHIWGEANNPVFFSNFWNLAVVPDYLNPILDKTESPQSQDYFDRAVCYVKGFYKQFVYQLYNMEQKIADYEALGVHIQPIFEGVHTIEINETVNLKMLQYLEDQGF